MDFRKNSLLISLLALSFFFSLQAATTTTTPAKKVLNCLPSELMHLASACFPTEESPLVSEDLCCELVKSVTSVSKSEQHYDLKECLCTAATVNRIVIGRDRRVSTVIGSCTGESTIRYQCFSDI
ncbi:hypothetical protein A4A49_16855 [Nicotiana attenuata]|uniref:Bifunctional inhibitor/plant lipid transfer protein/seed storage helical domain-containing protein n=1 Tax=Nicotiana attenuata TaxID=49451 RepID=A0A1J6J389_NICAT|nr:hypothetical protein A4A49_16855 [Nicotiana attenuata]